MAFLSPLDKSHLPFACRSLTRPAIQFSRAHRLAEGLLSSDVCVGKFRTFKDIAPFSFVCRWSDLLSAPRSGNTIVSDWHEKLGERADLQLVNYQLLELPCIEHSQDT